MKNILFAEDNEVLQEMYTLMMKGDKNWKTTVVPNGKTALDLLQNNYFDVVASDMEMPGMSGIELLSKVREIHPKTARIIISGMCDQAMAADSLNSTHLFIPKPFEIKTFRDSLTRINNLDAYLKNENLQNLAGKMKTLPSFPKVYMELIKAMDDPNTSIQNIATIVSQDPSITAKVLQIVNSAAFGQTEQISDTVEAVQTLGLGTVKSIALSTQVFGSFSPTCLKDFSCEKLWTHLIKTAALARDIMRSQKASASDTEDAYTAGMLHDIGQLMLAHSLPEEFAKVLQLAKQNNLPLQQAETEILGASHAGLAAYLFSLWGLPATVTEAVAFHHEPEKSNLHKFSVLTAIHVADGLNEELEKSTLNMDYLQKIDVKTSLSDWKELAQNYK